MSLLRKKTFEDTVAESKSGKALKKTLGAMDLVLLGIGCTIGTGIFVLTGVAAAEHAGPAISLSYVFAAVACIFAGLAYTELAAAMPVAGGAYTYSYTIIGEFVAWIVGCGLMLEYTVGASTVAAGWSGYFTGILKSGGIELPVSLTQVPANGGIVNLPAMFIALFVGSLLIRGTKESVVVNRILVAVKLVVIFLFLIIAAPHIQTERWTNDFMPFGVDGVITGAATIFFAYIGFDAVATAAEETKNPNKDLPIGIIGSLICCSLLYVAVALALTGITHYSELGNAEPIAYALRQNGSNIGSAIVATGAVAGMIAVLLVLMYAQSRIFFVMSRDKLLPEAFSKMHKKFHTPYLSCGIVTLAVALISGFTPIQTLGHMTSFGTLFAFMVAAIAMVVFRIKRPDVERPFKCPYPYFVATMAVLICGYLVFKLLHVIAGAFFVWIGLSLAFYFLYSRKRSSLN